MARIPGVVEPKGPGPVLDFPRPRNIGPARTREALGEFSTARPAIMGMPGGALAGLGQDIARVGGTMLEHTVRQEISAETTRVKTEAARRIGEHRAAIESAGTVADARRIMEKDFPKLEGELLKYAEERGVPEAAPEVQLLLTHNRLEIVNGLAKQSAKEGVQNAALYAAAQEDAYAGARTPAEAERIYMQTSQELERVAATNPEMSPGDAQGMLVQMLERGSTRRANGLLAARANDPAGLRELAAEVQNPLAFRGMPEDQRAILGERALAGAERQELHQLAMADAMQARSERAVRRNQELHEAELTTLYVKGELTPEMLAGPTIRRDVDSTFARTMYNALTTVPAPRDDPVLTAQLWQDAADGNLTFTRIRDHLTAGNLTSDTGGQLTKAINADGGAKLSSAQKEVLDYVESQIVAKGPFGALDFESSQRLGNMKREGIERLLAGEDPEVVRKSLVQTYRAPMAVGPGVYGHSAFEVAGAGGQIDINATLQAIETARVMQQISLAEATREFERVEAIERAMLAAPTVSSEGRR